MYKLHEVPVWLKMTVGSLTIAHHVCASWKYNSFAIFKLWELGGRIEMAEGELNVDSVITRLLDGKNQLLSIVQFVLYFH